MADSLLTDLSEVLDLVVLEQLPGGFVQITAGPLPSWFVRAFRTADEKMSNSVAVALWFLKAWARLAAFVFPLEPERLYLFLKYAFRSLKLTENIVDHSPPHGSGRPGLNTLGQLRVAFQQPGDRPLQLTFCGFDRLTEALADATGRLDRSRTAGVAMTPPKSSLRRLLSGPASTFALAAVSAQSGQPGQSHGAFPCIASLPASISLIVVSFPA